MPRPKVSADEERTAAPIRMRRRYLKRLREMAKLCAMSPGEWIESQLEPYMPKESGK